MKLFFAPLANWPFMAVDLTVSNLLRASSTRSSKQLESFFFPASSLSLSRLSPPFSLSLVLMQQTDSFSSPVDVDNPSP